MYCRTGTCAERCLNQNMSDESLKGPTMSQIDIYTRPMCGFCHAAVRLLKQKGVEFREINIWTSEGGKAEMVQRSNGGMTVPQIFIGDTHVGGCDDLMALEREGKLDPLLQAA